MALTVYAEKMGFWHRGSGGLSVAPIDVCLTPPGVPVPYTNVCYAADLIKGSKTVRIDGEPTALEDYSETSTSIGDEGGTAGGSVVTGVIKGKGFFMAWSMTVSVEGRGVARHGDMMGQNSASHPPSSIDAAAVSGHANPATPAPAPGAAAQAAEVKVLEATGPGDSVPTEVPPCDFETITVKCGHGDGKRKGKDWKFSYDGQHQDNLKKGPGITTSIQVTAGYTSLGADKINVVIAGGPGYGCSKTHPLIVLTDCSDPEAAAVKKEGELAVELPVQSKLLDMREINWLSLAGVIEFFWFPPAGTRTYRLEVASCGVLADQSPGFRKLSRKVEVFSNAIHKLTFELPPGIAKENKEGPLFNLEDKKAETIYQGANVPTAVATEALKSFTFTRDGEDLSAKLKVGAIIDRILKVRSAITSVMDGIDGLTVGFKPVCEIEFLSGSLSIQWGAKEWKDQRVYKFWKVEAALTLIKATIGVKFGVQAFESHWYEVTLLAEGTITGEVPFSISSEADPDKAAGLTVGISGKIEGVISLTGQLGDRWLYVKGEANASITAGAEFKIFDDDPFALNIKLDWSGLEVKGDVQSKIWGVSGSLKYTLIEGSELYNDNFFEPKASA